MSISLIRISKAQFNGLILILLILFLSLLGQLFLFSMWQSFLTLLIYKTDQETRMSLLKRESTFPRSIHNSLKCIYTQKWDEKRGYVDIWHGLFLPLGSKDIYLTSDSTIFSTILQIKWNVYFYTCILNRSIQIFNICVQHFDSCMHMSYNKEKKGNTTIVYKCTGQL